MTYFFINFLSTIFRTWHFFLTTDNWPLTTTACKPIGQRTFPIRRRSQKPATCCVFLYCSSILTCSMPRYWPVTSPLISVWMWCNAALSDWWHWLKTLLLAFFNFWWLIYDFWLRCLTPFDMTSLCVRRGRCSAASPPNNAFPCHFDWPSILNSQFLITFPPSPSSATVATRGLGITVNTVNVHKRNIFSKLGINNTMEMVQYALKNGIIRIESWELKIFVIYNFFLSLRREFFTNI